MQINFPTKDTLQYYMHLTFLQQYNMYMYMYRGQPLTLHIMIGTCCTLPLMYIHVLVHVAHPKLLIELSCGLYPITPDAKTIIMNTL